MMADRDQIAIDFRLITSTTRTQITASLREMYDIFGRWLHDPLDMENGNLFGKLKLWKLLWTGPFIDDLLPVNIKSFIANNNFFTSQVMRACLKNSCYNESIFPFYTC